MEWHIITSSKGGVGKTLLSLLLLAYFLEEKQQEGSTLILDLNGMNTDSSAIVLYRTAAEIKRTQLELITDVKLFHQNAKDIIFQEAYVDNSQGKPQHYVTGWPANPFILMNPQLFADLLSTITLGVQKIEDELGLSPPLRRVIIDTNYHFCNLFGQDSTYYTEYTKGELQQGKLQGEEINIWFLWVYRQLEKLLGNNNEAAIVRATATAIESYLERENLSHPLRHVFTSVSLITSSQQEGIVSRLLNAMRNKQDHVIDKFKELEELEVGEGVNFNAWVTALNQAYNEVMQNKNEERAALFPEVLIKAVNRVSSSQKKQRPKNIIPLSQHQAALEHYTDKERPNAVAVLRNMKIYKRLRKIL